jgi:hypothetical protein
MSVESIVQLASAGIMVFVVLLTVAKGGKKIVRFNGKELVAVEDGAAAKRITAHQACPHSKDIPLAISAQRVLIEKITELRVKGILAEQMVLVENILDIIISKMRERYLKLLRAAMDTKEGLIASPEWDCYQKCLYMLRNEMKSMMKRYLKENHLVNKDGAEFESYIEHRTSSLLSGATELLNREYRMDNPSREQVYDANMELIPDIRMLIGQAIRQFKEIAQERADAITTYEKQIQASLEPFILAEQSK